MESAGSNGSDVVDFPPALDVDLAMTRDPVISALEKWQEADKQRAVEQTAFCAFETMFFANRKVLSGERAIYEAANARSSQAFDAQWTALGDLYRTVPTSLAGAVLMLRTMLTSDDGTFEHPEIATGVANVVRFFDGMVPSERSGAKG